MSAERYRECPRCRARHKHALDKHEAKVKAAYGKVPRDQYADLAADLRDEQETHRFFPKEFAEYYEVMGAETGTVVVSYYGKCGTCGLELSFTSAHPIEGIDEPSLLAAENPRDAVVTREDLVKPRPATTPGEYAPRGPVKPVGYSEEFPG